MNIQPRQHHGVFDCRSFSVDQIAANGGSALQVNRQFHRLGVGFRFDPLDGMRIVRCPPGRPL